MLINNIWFYSRERTQNTTQLEANIQHLKPGATYTFRVAAYNNAGPSPEAAQIQAETNPECKYQSNINYLKVKNILSIQWKKLWFSYNIIIKFDIYYLKIYL